MGAENRCTSCTYYVYDEEYGRYFCDVNMDEAEYIRLMLDKHYECLYYRCEKDITIIQKK